jgi:hypothetical protein
MSSYTQISAGIPFDTSYVIFQLRTTNGNVQNSVSVVDVAIGSAGSERVIANALLGRLDIGFSSTRMYYGLPLQIPKNTPISARVQNPDNGASSAFLSFIIFDGSFGYTEGCAGVDAVGFDYTNTHGTTTDGGGTADVKGSWAVLVASSRVDYYGFYFVFDTTNQNSSFGLGSLIDIAVGAAGSEETIVSNIFAKKGETLPYPCNNFYPVNIPKGTQISARNQSDSTVSPDRLLGITLYCLYK